MQDTFQIHIKSDHKQISRERIWLDRWFNIFTNHVDSYISKIAQQYYFKIISYELHDLKEVVSREIKLSIFLQSSFIFMNFKKVPLYLSILSILLADLFMKLQTSTFKKPIHKIGMHQLKDINMRWGEPKMINTMYSFFLHPKFIPLCFTGEVLYEGVLIN